MVTGKPSEGRVVFAQGVLIAVPGAGRRVPIIRSDAEYARTLDEQDELRRFASTSSWMIRG